MATSNGSREDSDLGIPGSPPQARGNESQAATISVIGLVKNYDGYRLKIDSLEIRPGIVAMLGQSGSGKSTLLRIMAELDPKYTGDVKYSFATDSSDNQRQLKQFSYAFQTANLLSNLTVRANLTMGCRLAGLKTTDVDAKAALLPIFDEFPSDCLRNTLLQRFPSELSVGQRQRVAVARAYLKARQGCRVLFADEPTANLDPRSANLCFTELCKWQRGDPSERLLILATHDLSLAAKADYVILLGVPEEADVGRETPSDNNGQGDRTSDNTFIVRLHGPTRDKWNEVERILLDVDGVPQEDWPREDCPAAVPAPRKDLASVGGSGLYRGFAKLMFFFQYFLRDISRGRDLWGTLLRLAIVVMLFLVMSVSSVLLHNVARFSRSVLESDPLLRLVHVESTGTFSITSDKMNELYGLRESDNGLHIESDSGSPSGRQVLSAVAPRWHQPLRLFSRGGELQRNWTDEVLVVYPENRELASPERIFEFWGTARLTRNSGIVVCPGLLRELGYDPDQVQSEIAAGKPVHLVAQGKDGWRIHVPIEGICEFPDQNVKILLPALLAHKIKEGDVTVIEERYRTAVVEAYPSAAAAQERAERVRQGFQTELGKIEGQAEAVDTLVVNVVESSLHPGAFSLQVSTSHPLGFGVEQMKEICTAIREHLPATYSVRGLNRRVPSRPIESDLPAKSHQATLYVTDYEDVPKVIDYLEANREHLQLKVLNPGNREFIRTAQLAVDALRYGVVVTAVMFAVACFSGILTSFSSMLRRKVAEIAVLKAFGAGWLFISFRFLFEALLVCSVSGLVAIALTIVWLIPTINDVVQNFAQSRATFAAPPLSFNAASWIFVAIVLAVAFGAQLLVAISYVMKNASELLSLSE